METTRVEKRARWEWPALQRGLSPDELRFEESLALFAVALAKESAPDLLRNLADHRRDRALAIATQLLEERGAVQPRMVRTFGPRPDAEARLRALYAGFSRALRDAIYRRLPPYQRSLFPDHRGRCGGEEHPLLGLLAERQIREATR